MSRSGYTDDDCGGIGLWRGAVRRSIKGKRGQAALKELAAAMDAMPNKVLAAESLVTEDGAFCTLGVLGQVRGIDMKPIDPEDWDAVAKAFNIAPAMVREIVYENDEGLDDYEWIEVAAYGPIRPFERRHRSVRVPIPEETLGPERWTRMRLWVEVNLLASGSTDANGAEVKP